MVWPGLKVFWFSKDDPKSTIKGKRRRGCEKKRWEDNIKEWTGMDFASSIRAAELGTRWKRIVAKSSVMPQQSSKVMGKKKKRTFKKKIGKVKS